MRLSFYALLFTLPTACSEYEFHPEKPENEEPVEAEPEVEIPVPVEEPVEDTAVEEDDSFDFPAIEVVPEEEPEEEPEEPPAPVAVCDVSPNPVSPPFESADWDGTGSYDPNGGTIVSYSWSLIQQPSGSAVNFPPQGQSTVTGFIPDLAGDYIGQLTVTNDSGISDSCEVTLESVPAQNLWVEMFWQHSGDDMDLHLINAGHNWNSSLQSTNDCYYANCVGSWSSLDWGTTGYNGDDPALDLDDIAGTGPENINIYDPATSGSYTVVVHDYPGSSYTSGNDVTVNIYLNGSLVWTDTRTISGEDSYTAFASIDWASATVTSL